MRVLLVDRDDSTYQDLYDHIGDSFHSFQIEFASYDADILQLIEERDVSIVLLRILFYDDRGVSILKKIRSEKKYGGVYIIIMVSTEQVKYISSYFKLGADDCVLTLENFTYLHARLMVAENNISNKKATHAAFQAYSDLKNMHSQLVQAEKLAGIGRLAAGVAHEINNPLGFVSGNIEALEKYIQRYHKVLELFKHIKDFTEEQCVQVCATAAEVWEKQKINRVMDDMEDLFSDTMDGIERISVIVTGLKNFSRINQQDEQGPFDLNDGIKMTLIVARNELKYDSDVTFEPGDIPMVNVNGGQINQVILNMLINAVHAIKAKFNGQKGNITIQTYIKDDDKDSVYLSIRDNGVGMSQDTVEHIFEPFFTTKPIGLGTGLGLGIAYDIIYNKHHGQILVNSEPGEGTEFIIVLPIQGVEQAEGF